jgi:hypothetical protein
VLLLVLFPGSVQLQLTPGQGRLRGGCQVPVKLQRFWHLYTGVQLLTHRLLLLLRPRHLLG